MGKCSTKESFNDQTSRFITWCSKTGLILNLLQQDAEGHEIRISPAEYGQETVTASLKKMAKSSKSKSSCWLTR
jgi:hypothetical protein